MPKARAYSTDLEGGAATSQRFVIFGHISEDYLDFVADRAGWLSLSGWARHASAGQVDVVAAGPEALVGALEMACMLGPLNALIEAVSVQTNSGEVPAGFEIRR